MGSYALVRECHSTHGIHCTPACAALSFINTLPEASG